MIARVHPIKEQNIVYRAKYSGGRRISRTAP